MAEYIDRESFIEQKRKQYCGDCERRKGMKNGKYKTLYEIGEAPCRACGIDDMLNDVEDFPVADVRPVKRGKWIDRDDDYYGWNMWACSACGEEFVLTDGTPDMNEYHFCPNCGADMMEES